MAASWQQGVIDSARTALKDAGAVVVRLSQDGPSVISRVYRTKDYKTTKDLRRVAIRQMTRAMNQDCSGCNHYVVIRYADGSLVAWTGMHSLLAEAAA
jgi:hypothetical protein